MICIIAVLGLCRCGLPCDGQSRKQPKHANNFKPTTQQRRYPRPRAANTSTSDSWPRTPNAPIHNGQAIASWPYLPPPLPLPSPFAFAFAVALAPALGAAFGAAFCYSGPTPSPPHTQPTPTVGRKRRGTTLSATEPIGATPTFKSQRLT